MATEQPEAKQPRKRIREKHYDIDDALFLQRSRTIRQHFVNNLAPFTVLDADFNNTFANDWLTSIEDCDTQPTYETMLVDLQQHTAEMKEARSACIRTTISLEYFVKQAFPKSESIWREFGFNERKKTRVSTTRTLLWIKVMKKIAEEIYAAELAAVAMPASVLTNLQTKADLLSDKEVAQEMFKRTIIRQMRQRTEKLNALYDFFSSTYHAAQIVFDDDKERKALFSLT